MSGIPRFAFRAWLTTVGRSSSSARITFYRLGRRRSQYSSVRAAYVFVHNATVAAVSLALTSSVFASQLWQAGQLAPAHRIVKRNCPLGLLIMLCTAALVIGAGEPLFDLWLGPGNFIGYGIFAVFLTYETLEAQSYILSTGSRATNDEAFAVPSVLAGSEDRASLCPMKQFGLLGLALGTMLAVLVTNHWFVVYRGLRRLQVPLGPYAKRVLLPCMGWFAAAGLAAWCSSRALAGKPEIVRLLGTATVVGVIFTAACVLLVLTPGERQSIWRKFFAMTGDHAS